MKKVVVSLVVLVTLISIPLFAMACDAPDGLIKARYGHGCPGGYTSISYHLGCLTFRLCVPVSSTSYYRPKPCPGPKPPYQPRRHNWPSPPRKHHQSQYFSSHNPPPLGSPPSLPRHPGGYCSPPGYQKNRAVHERPKTNLSRLSLVRKDMYFYYSGTYTWRASTVVGKWIPVYVNLSSGGNLKIVERYYNTGGTQNYSWGYRSAGWTKFWFHADTTGWHALISNTDGSWGNWIWIYVY